VIGVGNLNESMQKVVSAGGKIIGEPMEIPGVGMWSRSSTQKATEQA